MATDQPHHAEIGAGCQKRMLGRGSTSSLDATDAWTSTRGDDASGKVQSSHHPRRAVTKAGWSLKHLLSQRLISLRPFQCPRSPRSPVVDSSSRSCDLEARNSLLRTDSTEYLVSGVLHPRGASRPRDAKLLESHFFSEAGNIAGRPLIARESSRIPTKSTDPS